MTYTVEITQHTLSQRSPARSGIENSWPMSKAKVKGVLLLELSGSLIPKIT